jgi:GPH family glycoside/pentoside/hexuronide:cation symporter
MGVAAPPAEAGGELRPSAGVKAFYSVGQAVESGYLAVATFVFFYYTAVLGLSGSLVGLALAISMALDGFFDPFIGSWSDGVRSKWGRRLPVMLVGAPLTFVTMGLLFSPPSNLTPFLMFGWLTLTKMGVRASASIFNLPYFALGGEMSSDYVERGSIVAIRLFAGVMFSVLVTALAYSVFFAGVGGLQRPDRYPAFGWTIAALVLVCGAICCLGVWRYSVRLPQPVTAERPMAQRFAGEVAEIFRNRSFRVLFFSLVLFTTAAGMSSNLNNHAYTFVWKLRPENIQFMSYAYLLGILLGIPITPFMMARMEKKAVVMVGFGVVIVTWLILPPLRAAGLFTPTGLAALPWLIASSGLIGLGSGPILIAYPAMMADAADEHELLNGARREGLYFAGLGFAGKAAAGLGAMIGGFALDLLHFPHDVGREAGAVVAEPVLRRLVLAWAPAPAMLCLVGVAIFASYGITRVRHEDITARLKLKRAEDVRAGRST